MGQFQLCASWSTGSSGDKQRHRDWMGPGMRAVLTMQGGPTHIELKMADKYPTPRDGPKSTVWDMLCNFLEMIVVVGE